MGFIIMFDITSEKSFMSIRPWLDQLKLHSYFENPDIVLCGNKADLEDKRVISWSKANTEANKYGIPYFETSAATGQNVSKAIEALLDLVMIRMHKVVESSLVQQQQTKDNGISGGTGIKLNVPTSATGNLSGSNSKGSTHNSTCTSC